MKRMDEEGRGRSERPGPRRSPSPSRRLALGLGAVLAFAAALTSCATRPASSASPLLVEPGPAAAQALDQNRVRVSFEVTTTNRSGRGLEGLAASCALQVAGRPAGSAAAGGPFDLDPGESRLDRFELTVDLRDLEGRTDGAGGADDAELAWETTAEIRAPASGAVLGAAEARGSFPRVREPELVVKSIILVKHELINVLLDLVLDIANPNAFPVEFYAASYQFFGEGRKWSNGEVARSVSIPARGTAEVRLPLTLNFTETGRGLFDLVAKLQVVRFRLTGEAGIRTPLPFLPEFRMKFDAAGAVRVERTLGR